MYSSSVKSKKSSLHLFWICFRALLFTTRRPPTTDAGIQCLDESISAHGREGERCRVEGRELWHCVWSFITKRFTQRLNPRNGSTGCENIGRPPESAGHSHPSPPSAWGVQGQGRAVLSLYIVDLVLWHEALQLPSPCCARTSPVPGYKRRQLLSKWRRLKQ